MWTSQKGDSAGARTPGRVDLRASATSRDATANSSLQAQQLLGAYPFASATPSTHIARHLSNLSLAVAPPSYVDPSYYTVPTVYGSPSLYDTETSQLSNSRSAPGSDERSFWETSRDDLVQTLGDQTAANAYDMNFSYWNPSAAHSTFHTSAFATSLMQHVAPSNAYPTPPPASYRFSPSSSSLAGALGSPKRNEEKYRTSTAASKSYSAAESGPFFDEYLREKIKKLPESQPRRDEFVLSTAVTPPGDYNSHQSRATGRYEASPLTPAPPSDTSPKKRKHVEVVISTPSKRHTTNPDRDRGLSELSNTPVKFSSSSATTERLKTPLNKSKVECYVEITTPKSWTEPVRVLSETVAESSPDLGGYGAVNSDDYDNRTVIEDGMRSPGKKTGDRDDRAPLEKLLNLLEDIFEAEDSISMDGDPEKLSLRFFSKHSRDLSRPTLNHTVIGRLTKAIGKVARPSKRTRLAAGSRDVNAPTSPRKTGGIADIEVQTLLRILKILERSVREGELIDPLGGQLAARSGLTNERTGEDQSVSSNAQNARERDSEGAKAFNEAVANDSEMTKDVLVKLESSLEIARDSVIAADCCIALLTSDRLAKQLYLEELINGCLSVVRTQLTKIIYPFVELPASDVRELSTLLKFVASHSSALSSTTDAPQRLIGEVFRAICAVLPRINNLVCADALAMPDAIVIQAVYISIGPFFIVESGESDYRAKKDAISSLVQTTLGSSGMRGLRLEALSLIRTIFAKYEEQRSWIIEEILSSLVKLSDSKQKASLFRLRDGRSIRTVSALLLQLVQTSAHDVRVEARRIAKRRQQQLVSRPRENSVDTVEQLLSQEDLEELKLYSAGLEAPARAAKSIVLFLTQRSGKGKSTKNANEQEYRAIFENLISDLLIVLFWPEWPAAGLVLSVILKYMMASLEDLKSPTNNENNAGKATALDHLGSIAGRLRTNTLKWSRRAGTAVVTESSLQSIEELVPTADTYGLERLISVHQEIAAHLSKRVNEDQAYETARELSGVIWGHELASALTQLNGKLSNVEGVTCAAALDTKLLAFASKVKATLRSLWRDAPADVFDNATQEEIIRVDSLSEQAGTTQSLRNAFDPILNAIIAALDATAVFVRTKALRALGQILAVDSTVLTNPNVRHAIEAHLLDSSPQVRDAAVELIGKYMTESTVVADEYYQKIAERIADTGLGVRKRVIKLLKTFYYMNDDLSKKVDICSKIILRMLDEDDSVKDLAIKTMEELWFATQSSANPNDNPLTGKRQLLQTASVIMGVCGNFKDRQSPLEDLLSKVVSKDEPENTTFRKRFTELVDVIIDGLIDASGSVNLNVINSMRSIHLFTNAYPPIITGNRASALLSYLKNPTTLEEHVISDYIMKIYCASIPHMTRTSVKFGADLQLVLQPMVLKPNAQTGLASLPVTVACLCATVQHLTHDFLRLVALMRSCSTRVQQFISKNSSKLDAQEARALHIVVLILSLLGENFDFDHLKNENVEAASQLKTIAEGSVILHIYECILKLHGKYADNSVRGRLLVCLGFLFRAQPTLMTLESSASMMDAIFASSETDNRARLLKLMQDFLVSEATKHAVQERELTKQKIANLEAGVNMEELIGNTQGFAESGVSSAIVQRYLPQILDCALSTHAQIQNSAVDILSHTIKQGLAHPLMSFPVIVALETSPANALSSRAAGLHTTLHHKHASLLSSGFIPACRKSYDYQLLLFGNDASNIQGFRMSATPTALLTRWYALVREKRTSRQEFLRCVLRVFEVQDMKKTAEDTVHFARYMAGNFAHFDYRTQEEVLTVVKTLTRELAESGVMLAEHIAPGMLSEQLKSTSKGDQRDDVVKGLGNREEFSELPLKSQVSVMRSTCVIGIIMLLKAHLKSTYGLSEEKCQKFILGRKSVLGDRPAVRRKDVPVSWERLPFTCRAIVTHDDIQSHKSSFLELWMEDGVTAEPAEEEPPE